MTQSRRYGDDADHTTADALTVANKQEMNAAAHAWHEKAWSSVIGWAMNRKEKLAHQLFCKKNMVQVKKNELDRL